MFPNRSRRTRKIRGFNRPKKYSLLPTLATTSWPTPKAL
jgi:hypothetical protein